jgi:hypothetical protein
MGSSERSSPRLSEVRVKSIMASTSSTTVYSSGKSSKAELGNVAVTGSIQRLWWYRWESE